MAFLVRRRIFHDQPVRGPRIKGYLWNGNHRWALPCIEWLIDDLDAGETDYPGVKAFRKAAGEFNNYIANNAGMIPNYAERRCYG
jgi:hypothetical protein